MEKLLECYNNKNIRNFRYFEGLMWILLLLNTAQYEEISLMCLQNIKKKTLIGNLFSFGFNLVDTFSHLQNPDLKKSRSGYDLISQIQGIYEKPLNEVQNSPIWDSIDIETVPSFEHVKQQVRNKFHLC